MTVMIRVFWDSSGWFRLSLTYGAAGLSSWHRGALLRIRLRIRPSSPLLCASTDGRVLAGGASAGAPSLVLPSAGARANAGFDASVMPLVWDESGLFRVLGVGGSLISVEFAGSWCRFWCRSAGSVWLERL